MHKDAALRQKNLSDVHRIRTPGSGPYKTGGRADAGSRPIQQIAFEQLDLGHDINVSDLCFGGVDQPDGIGACFDDRVIV